MSTKILVVDDEPNLLRVSEFALESAGFEVQLARSGREGQTMIREFGPDVLILDVRLPDISGIEICRQLRSDPATINLPVLMISAFDTVEDRVKALEAGATDYLVKPVATDELIAEVQSVLESLRRQQAASVADQESSPRILVVEDEPGLLRVMEVNLQFEGFEIITAESGVEALEKINSERPALVILDVMLPDMSGLDICRHLRSSPDLADLPVIMVSALVDVEDKVKGLQAGADEYVPKPVEAEELVARVKAQLRRIRGLQESSVPVGERAPQAAKIMVVDDEPSLLRLMAFAFDVEGFSTVTAESGKEALAKILAERPDLVVLDVVMPDLNGIDLCRRLRAAPETADLPVIMVSVKNQAADRVAGIRAGANDYLSKPVDSDELVARAQAILERERLRNQRTMDA